jgi:hypothetical protein
MRRFRLALWPLVLTSAIGGCTINHYQECPPPGQQTDAQPWPGPDGGGPAPGFFDDGWAGSPDGGGGWPPFPDGGFPSWGDAGFPGWGDAGFPSWGDAGFPSWGDAGPWVPGDGGPFDPTDAGIPGHCADAAIGGS